MIAVDENELAIGTTLGARVARISAQIEAEPASVDVAAASAKS